MYDERAVSIGSIFSSAISVQCQIAIRKTSVVGYHRGTAGLGLDNVLVRHSYIAPRDIDYTRRLAGKL